MSSLQKYIESMESDDEVYYLLKHWKKILKKSKMVKLFRKNPTWKKFQEKRNKESLITIDWILGKIQQKKKRRFL